MVYQLNYFVILDLKFEERTKVGYKKMCNINIWLVFHYIKRKIIRKFKVQMIFNSSLNFDVENNIRQMSSPRVLIYDINLSGKFSIRFWHNCDDTCSNVVFGLANQLALQSFLACLLYASPLNNPKRKKKILMLVSMLHVNVHHLIVNAPFTKSTNR